MILCKNCTFLENCFYCQVVGTRTECKTYKPMTNEEYIRTCSTEELAECIIGIDYGADDKDTKIAKLVEWLNQPHTFIDY